MGPLVPREHYGRVPGYLDLAREEGATVRSAGERRTDDLFMPPTPLEDVDPDMRVVREEILGPVSALTTFTHEADAIRKDIATVHGPSASV